MKDILLIAIESMKIFLSLPKDIPHPFLQIIIIKDNFCLSDSVEVQVSYRNTSAFTTRIVFLVVRKRTTSRYYLFRYI